MTVVPVARATDTTIGTIVADKTLPRPRRCLDLGMVNTPSTESGIHVIEFGRVTLKVTSA